MKRKKLENCCNNVHCSTKMLYIQSNALLRAPLYNKSVSIKGTFSGSLECPLYTGGLSSKLSKIYGHRCDKVKINHKRQSDRLFNSARKKLFGPVKY